jgi:hypothetical protein
MLTQQLCSASQLDLLCLGLDDCPLCLGLGRNVKVGYHFRAKIDQNSDRRIVPVECDQAYSSFPKESQLLSKPPIASTSRGKTQSKGVVDLTESDDDVAYTSGK